MTDTCFLAELSAASPKNEEASSRPGKRHFHFFLVRVWRYSEIPKFYIV
ncbi:hypothetical protein HMPREF1207_02075 [Paenibacillus sp. HGH0039]|nr:hypothetical protein HMPREF1207_02075 [Paenibacillus sp. HGH0039]